MGNSRITNRIKRLVTFEVAIFAILCLLFWIPRSYLIHRLGFKVADLSSATSFYALVFDLIVAGYILAPLLVLRAILPNKFQSSRPVKILWYGYASLALLLATSCCVSEVFFIDEFSARYNFIAVDYLVYTSEVLKNIHESYPIVPFVCMAVAVTGALSWAVAKADRKLSRSVAFSTLLIFGCLSYGIKENDILSRLNDIQGEISKNSFHALFAAFRNNQLDFEKFYTVMNSDQAIQNVQEELAREFKSPRVNEENRNLLVSNLVGGPNVKRWNVVLVAMESMSARYLTYYGGSGLTPNLDQMREESLAFDNVYATGTRTVRGLEAILLSLPPTPGQSILRRPNSGNLFSLGSVLASEGYDRTFIYGGRSFFDNMREFFEGNGFQVLDQTSLLSDQIHFSNAWGVCDEDTFDFAIREADKSATAGRSFLQVVLTTSNHRPYTFPQGRIDRTHPDRESAVKYADFAIGRYIKEVSTRPWFDKTIFVFVADHDASVSGGTSIVPDDYKIPFMVYAPNRIAPQKFGVMGSQIDVAPTILGLLGLSYQSRFFGHDLRWSTSGRAFLGTYQKVAYMEDQRMIVLSPKRKWDEFNVSRHEPRLVKHSSKMAFSNELLKRTVSYYQAASIGFTKRLFGLETKYSNKINVRRNGR